MGAGRPSAWAAARVDAAARTVLAPKKAIAELTGANASWISSLNIAPAEGSLYDVRSILRAYVEYREGVARRRGEKTAAESDDMRALRAERLRLQNERSEIDIRNARGELLSVDQLSIVWTRSLAAFRSALEVIPRKLAAVEGVSRNAEVELAGLIDQALRDLADLDLGSPASGVDGVVVASDPPTAAEDIPE